MHLNTKVQKYFLITSSIIILTSYLYSSYLYSGNKIIFFIFFLSIHIYLIIAFFFSDLFFDKVLSTFLWLGFYLTIFFKITLNITRIIEGEGNFKFLPDQFDKVLIYSTVGFIGFTLSSLFHSSFINIKKLKNVDNFRLIEFYNKYKNKIIFIFFLLIVSINFYNFKFEIYQKGLIALTSIHPFLSIILKFFIIFGLTAISTLLIDYENKSKNKVTFLILLIFYFEITLTNTVLLSRSYIFLGGFILLATLISHKTKGGDYYNSFIFNIIFLFFTFLINVQFIETLRDSKYFDKNFVINELKKNYANKKSVDSKNLNLSVVKPKEKIVEPVKPKEKIASTLSDEIKLKEKIIDKRFADSKVFYNRIKKIIFLVQNRFVGFEALAIVTHSNNQSSNTFWNSFNEKINFNGNASYYSANLMNRKDNSIERQSERQISVYLPGIIAFCAYHGSLLFLFFSIFFVHLIAGVIEKSALVFSYNCKVFSCFIGFVLAYRLIHFGYVPNNSYMLLGAILLTIFAIFILSKTILKLSKE